MEHLSLTCGSSLSLRTDGHASNRPHCTPLFSASSSSISASLKQHGRPLTRFYRGFNHLALTSPSTSLGRSISSRRGASHTLIVMRNNAADGYASALAEIGRSQNVLEGINADMEKLGRFLQDKQLFAFLTNPTVSEEKKKSVLKSLADDAGFAPYTLNLLNIVVDRKRTVLLHDIVKKFEELYNEITDTEVAIVTSAIKINTNQLAQIAKKIQSMSGAKNVRMKNVVDASLVAGFVVRYGKDGSRFVDMSVKGQLDRITQQIKLAEETGVAII